MAPRIEFGAFFIFGKEMNQQNVATNPVNGASAAHELFALTDEQILEIEPQEAVASDEWRVASEKPQVPGDGPSASKQGNHTQSERPVTTAESVVSAKPTQLGAPALSEPPAWLARQMKDPWAGEEARELWEGVQRAQAEAAEYRTALATPAEAKSLKEIYPGGIEQARAAAERARALDEFDAAYFGVAGKSAEESSAARVAL